MGAHTHTKIPHTHIHEYKHMTALCTDHYVYMFIFL